jgi:hypothetical protein
VADQPLIAGDVLMFIARKPRPADGPGIAPGQADNQEARQ